MTRAHKLVIERETGGTYVARFPEWAGCQAQAGSLKTLTVRIQEAMALRPEGPEGSGTNDQAAATHPAGVPRQPRAPEDL
jgi:predicted RNase H-like HicB family nuclease